MVLLVYDAIGHLKEKGMGVTDLAPNLTNIEQIVLEKSKEYFGMYGIEINKVSGLYINLPEEVQKAVDTRVSMQVLGANYLQYQTGQAMREAAQNPSGAAGAGVGIGAGIGAGYAMIGCIAQAAQQSQPAQQPGKACIKCETILPADAKFCSNCGVVIGNKKCPNCGFDIPASSKFCSNCGKSF